MEEIMKMLGKVAPWLAAAATGPVGLAGMAIKTVAETLGAKSEAVEDILSAAAGATPDQIAALRVKDLDFKLRMQELGFKNIADMAKIAAEDRDSARKANVASGMNGWLFAMSIVLLAMSLGTEMFVLFRGYPPEIPDLVVGRVLGLMDAVAMMVLAYWYGTTHGSDKKNALLANMEPAK